jgi:hypothetical protein
MRFDAKAEAVHAMEASQVVVTASVGSLEDLQALDVDRRLACALWKCSPFPKHWSSRRLRLCPGLGYSVLRGCHPDPYEGLRQSESVLVWSRPCLAVDSVQQPLAYVSSMPGGIRVPSLSLRMVPPRLKLRALGLVPQMASLRTPKRCLLNRYAPIRLYVRLQRFTARDNANLVESYVGRCLIHVRPSYASCVLRKPFWMNGRSAEDLR